MALDNTLNIEISASVDNLKKGLTQAEKGVKNFSGSTDRMTAKTNKMAGAVRVNAVPAMTSFSQVIQDSPYGIRGVANNIQQLTSQFGYLSAKTGGAKGALKSMIGALAGPAGILLAVSAVTSLLVSYGDEISEFIFGTDKAKKSVDSLNASLKTQLEITKLLKQEVSVAAEIRKAEAKLNGKNASEQYSIYKQFQEARILTLEQQVKNTENTRKKAAKLARLAENQDNEDIQEAAKKAYNDRIKLDKELYNTKAQLYLADLNEQIRINGETKKNVEKSTREIVKPLTNLYANDIPQLQSTALSGFGVDFWKRVLDYENLEIEKEKIKKSLADLNLGAKNIIEGSIVNTFSNLGNAIGEAMANGGDVLQASVNAITNGLADLLGAMGDYLIKAGTAAVLAGTVTKLFGSITGVGAGLAAIAGGTLLNAFAGSIKSFGGAGNTSTGSDYSSGSNNYGSSVSYGGGGGGGTYVFEIAGTKLIGVLKNTLDRNRALGGSNNLVFG